MGTVLWESDAKEDPDVKAKAEYDANNHTFTVTVSRNDKTVSENFVALYEPRFGIDMADMDHIYQIADKLMDEITA